MADFTYSPQPARLKPFFEHIQPAGVPTKVTQKYLESVGFMSKNDRYLISILKFIGFLDTNGVPTEKWRAYRNREAAPGVIAQAIRTAYSDLFDTFPDAYRKDNEALRNYFSTHTTHSERTIGLLVRTFTALCELANFDTVPKEESVPKRTTPETAEVRVPQTTLLGSSGMTVNLNIQLTLPATEDTSIYEKLFAAMKKNLLS